jgi:hypothetical protein
MSGDPGDANSASCATTGNKQVSLLSDVGQLRELAHPRSELDVLARRF